MRALGLLLLICSSLPAHDHPEEAKEEGPGRAGPDKAVLAANRGDGMKLSDDTVRILGLRTASVGARVPLSALVHYQDEVGVYRLRDGWYKLIEVKVTSRGPKGAAVRGEGLSSSDQIVVQGAALLRVAELEVWGGSGDGHGH